MSAITKLPCEIVNAALLHVGSLQNLSSALLSCRHVYTSFHENPHLAVDILRKQIAPELLPYAVAVMEASHLAPRTAPTIRALLDRLNRSVQKEPRESAEPATNLLDKVPFARLAQMSQTHDIVHGFVTAFSTRAWERLSQSASPGVQPEEDSEPTRETAPLSLSPGEHSRFCRAFYRLELYTRLFSQPAADSPEDGDKGEAADGASFLRAFPVWENEAIGCVQEFVELEFAKGEWASRDVLAHDVFFGEMAVDYLLPGFMNDQRQTWLGQGICFVHKLKSAPSYEAKHKLLASTFTSSSSNLHETLVQLYGDDQAAGFPLISLKDYTDEQRTALFQPSEPAVDADKGPFEAWWAANRDVPLASSLMMAHNAGFREQAYVLWDEDRLTRHGLLAVFTGNAPASELEREGTESQQDEMEESFEARSEIYQDGGLGYWSKDDESRIVYSGKELISPRCTRRWHLRPGF